MKSVNVDEECAKNLLGVRDKKTIAPRGVRSELTAHTISPLTKNQLAEER